MRAIIVAISLCLPVFSFADTRDASHYVMLSAKMDSHHVPPFSKPVSGEMTLTENSIRLFIAFEKNCPADLYCSDEVPEPLEITLPITEATRGRCVFTYVATRDQTPVDGLRETIAVRIPGCDGLESPAVQAIEVTYTTAGFDRREREFCHHSAFAFRPE